jgi:glycosyltransferase involved in cell wall biosynthesis
MCVRAEKSEAPASLGDASGMGDAMTPFVSVIMPCRNEVAFLGRCLDSILAGDYPRDRMEVIVADGMSDDGTREVIAQYAARDSRVRMIDNPARITPVALNLALREAQGDVIARIDAHAWVAPDYLSRCVHYLKWTDADNVGGTMHVVAQSEGPFARAIATALSHPFGVGNAHYRFGGTEPRWVDTVQGGCWRREVFSRIGPFNEKLCRSQDMEFNLRLRAAGGKTLFAPEIRYDYFARSDLRSFWRHNFWNGEWAVLPFLYSRVIPVSLRHLIPLIFATGLMVGAMALPWSRWPIAMVAIPYACINVGASVHAAWRGRKISLLASMPVAFGSLHLGYGFGSVAGVFRIAGRGFRPLMKVNERHA